MSEVTKDESSADSGIAGWMVTFEVWDQFYQRWEPRRKYFQPEIHEGVTWETPEQFVRVYRKARDARNVSDPIRLIEKKD